MAREAKCIKPVKRKSTVVSSQTYRKMVEEVLEEATANALDLHGIYEALAVKYDQYRDDSVEVDWRNSVRHCLSINEKFIRILPEAIRLTFFPDDSENPIFYRVLNGETVVNKSFWSTAELIKRHHWQPFIVNTGSNVKRALAAKIINDTSEILPSLQFKKSSKGSFNRSVMDIKPSFNIQDIHPSSKQHVAIARRPSISDMLVSEWIDPSAFIDVTPAATNTIDFRAEIGSPMALQSGNQAALFNMAVIEEDDRILRMRQRLKAIQLTMPNSLGPLKIDYLSFRNEKEPAKLPSPNKEVNTFAKESPQMVSLPPIFNHSI